MLQKKLDFTLKVVGGDISAIPGLSEAIEVWPTIYFLNAKSLCHSGILEKETIKVVTSLYLARKYMWSRINRVFWLLHFPIKHLFFLQ